MSFLVHNARIWRSGLKYSEDKRQFYDWILFDQENGKIISCGGDGDAKPDAKNKIDMQKKWIFPGFHDSHIHVMWHGFFLTDHTHLGFPRSITKMQENLKDLLNDPYNAPDSNTNWFVGYGFEQGHLGRFPTALDLDEVEADRPVLIYHHSLHIAVLNTAGLRTVGYDEDSRPKHDNISVYPPGHELEGIPDGILKEGKLDEAVRMIPRTVEMKQKAILSALNDCVKLGITSVHCLDADCWKEYVELAKNNELPIQCFFSTFYDDFVKVNKPEKCGESHGPFLKCSCVKIFTDGALGSDTARLSLPYKKKHPNGEDNYGVLFYSQEELNRMVKEVDSIGYQLEIHVIGDEAAEYAVNALERAGITPDKRPILVHCQVLNMGLIKRMAKLGVIAAIQPQNVPEDARWARDKLPDALQECMYPYQTMLDNGIICAGSSDSPAYFPNSLTGIHDAIFQPDCAVTERVDKPQEDKPSEDEMEGHGSALWLNGSRIESQPKCFQPKERMTFTDAVDAYTSEAAKTDFAESFLGRLEPGYFANFVVLDFPEVDGKDLIDLSEHPELLPFTKVTETWARGTKLYDATSGK